jgi:molybdopterin/thiamine biosynthesis adenylyltransferase
MTSADSLKRNGQEFLKGISDVSFYSCKNNSLESLIKKINIDSVYDNRDLLSEEIFEVEYPHISKQSEMYIEEFRKFKKSLEDKFNWVYFPWDKKLVACLSDDLHYRLITARNRNMVTKEEHELLRRVNIGIIGLSVGQSSALSLVGAGISRNLKLADFDTLSGSNLNRLDGGIDEIGLIKTQLVARRILKLNPYYNLKFYEEPISKDNLGDFLLSDFKLDFVIDAFDSISAKITLRRLAKKHGITVIMGTDIGNGVLLNVETPKDPIFFGALPESEIDKIENGEKLTLMEMSQVVPKILALEKYPDRFMGHIVSMSKGEISWMSQLRLASSLTGVFVTYAIKQIVLGNEINNKVFLNLEEIIK